MLKLIEKSHNGLSIFTLQVPFLEKELDIIYNI